jgi:hypothetical protein
MLLQWLCEAIGVHSARTQLEYSSIQADRGSGEGAHIIRAFYRFYHAAISIWNHRRVLPARLHRDGAIRGSAHNSRAFYSCSHAAIAPWNGRRVLIRVQRQRKNLRGASILSGRSTQAMMVQSELEAISVYSIT